MAKFIGRRVAVGIGKESTRGTSVAATYWEKQAELSVDDMIDQAVDTSAFGQIEDAENAHIVGKYMEGSVTAKVKDRSFGMWLLSLMGTDTPALVETGVYDHVFTVENSNQHQSLTVSVDDPVQDYRYARAVPTSLELMAEIGKIMDFKIGFNAQVGATATNTPSYIAENYFLPQMGTFKHAADISGLGAASNIAIKKFVLKVEPNVERDMVLGSVNPSDFHNKSYAVSGEIELLFENEADWKTHFLADTARAMRLTLVNTGVTIGAASNPTVTITLAKAKFSALERSMGIDDLVSQKVSFKGLYSASDTSLLGITVRNAVASY